MLSQVFPRACLPILVPSRESSDAVSYNVLRRAASTSAAARQRLRANLRRGPELDDFIQKTTSLARKRDERRVHVRVLIHVLYYACAWIQRGLNS